MTENKKHTKIKFVVPFVIGILVCASVIGVLMFLPVFQPNIPIDFIFNEPTTTSNPANITDLPSTIVTGNEAVTCADQTDSACHGETVFAYHGTIDLTIYLENGGTPYQTLSIEIPSVSVLDMINYNAWQVAFEWNYSTRQWQQQSPITFETES